MSDKQHIKQLAIHATHYLLLQQPVPVEHPAGWQRDGFPLPIKRMPPNADGSVNQEYRPMAILEYVQEYLSGEIASKIATSKKVDKLQVPS